MAEFQYPVVAVGASAGGIEALKTFVECLPGDIRAAFVILQHLAPDYDSQLVSILDRNGKLPCREANSGTVIEPGNIYVLPPNRYLKVLDQGLLVEETSDPRGKRMPIDYFMRSLAETAGPQAVGIVLSGTGSDGTLGLRAIKGKGGLTFVQSPETALYDGMPRAAIEAHHADRVGSIEDICVGVSRFAEQGGGHDGKTFGPADLQSVIAIIKARTGYDFHAYKPGTISRRVRRRLNLLRIERLEEYVALLRSDTNEVERLANDLLINVTSFFRDGTVWDEVVAKVLAPLIENAGDRPVRIWVPACSSGEEPYTLAMLLHEYCERTDRGCDWQIFASDLDEYAIEKGRAGVYPESIAGDVSDERLAKFFVRGANGFQIQKALREKVVFAKQDVLSDPPFSRLDLISCRNLLIYIDKNNQNRLIETFHFALNDNGYLLLGTSDTIPAASRLFKPIASSTRIYARKEGRGVVRVPKVQSNNEKSSDLARPSKRTTIRIADDLGDRVRRSLLERYAPAGVVVDQKGEIEHYTGPVRRFIDTPEGKPTNNLFDLLNASLRARTRKVMRDVSRGKTASDGPAMLRIGGEDRAIRIDCTRLPVEDGDDEQQFLVTFVETGAAGRADGDQTVRAANDGANGAARSATARDRDADDAEEYARQLENELEVMREDLQTTVEELETSNEELKTSHEEAMASNEELQSTNEELETSREEMQSLNEELVTVNHQLEDKVEEVERSTDDLRNLLTSTRLPVLFLDGDLNISSFTSTMSGLIELRDSDIGRPIGDLAMKIDDPDLIETARAVLENLKPIEQEIGTDDGRIFLRRLQPYRTGDERIAGVVATFTDITQQATAARQMAESEERARIVADLGTKALSARTVDQFLNEVCASLRGALDCDFAKVLRLDTKNDRFDLVAGAGWKPGLVGNSHVPNSHQSQAGYTLIQDDITLVEDVEKERRFDAPELLIDHDVKSGISTKIVLGTQNWGAIGLHDRETHKFRQRDCDILRSVANIVSMTLTQLTREEFLTRERLSLSLALGIAKMGVWTFDPKTQDITLDSKLRAITGLSDFVNQPKRADFFSHIHPDDREIVNDRLHETASGGPSFEAEFRFIRPDGEQIWLEGKGEVITTNGGERVMLGVDVDVTARKQAEEQAEFMMRELDHRVKNLLAVILSICRITSKTADDVESFADAFTARLDAMARTHSLLAQSRWHGTNLRTLLQEEVGSQAGGADQVTISGPEVAISPSSAQSLSMLFHELTTNAIKHGALSSPDGHLEVSWKRHDEADEKIELDWIEKGGPSIGEPSRKGFGTKVINRLARSDLGSNIKTRWHETGLHITLALPTHRLNPRGEGDKTERKLSAPISYDVLADMNVLVLDDEWLIAEQHADILSGVGAKVIGPFLTLEEAMKTDIEKVDLAILDFALQDHDVLPLADMLREAGVPIVFISGYGSNMELPRRFSEELTVAKPAGASAMLESAAWIMTNRKRKR